jgi:hypothetical protein
MRRQTGARRSFWVERPGDGLGKGSTRPAGKRKEEAFFSQQKLERTRIKILK